MIVLSEASANLAPSPSARDIASSTEAAKLAGARVFYIEQDFSNSGDAEGASRHIPRQTLAIWGELETQPRGLRGGAEKAAAFMLRHPERRRAEELFIRSA